MIEKNQRRLRKKSATSVTKVFYICSMVVHCETNCNEICPMMEKNQRSLKKKRNKCNKGILYMQYGGSL